MVHKRRSGAFDEEEFLVHLYKGILDGNSMHDALSWILESHKAINFSVVDLDLAQSRIESDVRVCQLSEEWHKDYVSYYAHISPFRAILLRPQNIGRVFSTAQIRAEVSYEATEFYSDYYVKNGIKYLLAGVLAGGEKRFTYLSIHRPSSAGEFDQVDLRRMQRLCPHLKTMHELSRQISKIGADYSSMMAAADTQEEGIILLDNQGRVIETNRSAERIFLSHGAIQHRHSKIVLREPNAQARLDHLIQSTISFYASNSLVQRGCGQIVGSVKIRVPNGKHGSIILQSMPASLPSAFDRHRKAVVIVRLSTEAKAERTAVPQRVMNILTPAERRLAEELSTGRSAKEVARNLEISINTLATQRRGIYRKLNVDSQRAFLMRIRQLDNENPD